MATMVNETTETTENREESGDRPLIDANSAAIKKLIQRAKDRGYITYEELNQVLPPDQRSSEQIEDSMAALSDMGITVIESDEQDDSADGEKEEGTSARPSGNLDDEDIGRIDDPVRMYLREIGSVELLSREGEIAICKRIEAGHEKMLGGICESPLTIRALLAWRAALLDGKILLRDIIDLNATYVSDPSEAELAEAVAELEETEGEDGSMPGGKTADQTAAKHSAKTGAKQNSEDELEIGIGGHLAVPPLPHHRAYGSVPRRFDWVKLGQGHRVGGDRDRRKCGFAGPSGPPGVWTCARTRSANRRRPPH